MYLHVIFAMKNYKHNFIIFFLLALSFVFKSHAMNKETGDKWAPVMATVSAVLTPMGSPSNSATNRNSDETNPVTRINPLKNKRESLDEIALVKIFDGKKSWREVINDWKSGRIPDDLPYEGFLKSAKITSLDQPAWLVFFKDQSGELATFKQDYSPFNDQLDAVHDERSVTKFNNLKGDSELIVPIPEKDKDYTTLYRFMKNAPNNTKQALYLKTAEALEKTIDDQGQFLNTEGKCVHHLHVRLDKIPKYYDQKHKKYLKIN